MLTGWTGLVVLLALGLVAGVVLLTLWTRWMLTHPPRRTYATALARGRPGDPGEIPPPTGPLEFHSWRFESRGATLPAWDVLGGRRDGPVVVLLHGWGDSRIGGLSRAAVLAPHCSRLVLWDLPGHGEAPGTCSLGVLEVADAIALLDSLRGGTGSHTPIALLGWSLGAGVAIATAAARPDLVAGVIAENPYRLASTPARNVLVGERLPHRLNLPLAMALHAASLGWGAGELDGPRFDRAELARSVRCPLLVVSGERDEVSPAEDGRVIAAAGGRFVLLPAGGHHGLWTDAGTRVVLARECGEFLDALAVSVPAAGPS